MTLLFWLLLYIVHSATCTMLTLLLIMALVSVKLCKKFQSCNDLTELYSHVCFLTVCIRSGRWGHGAGRARRRWRRTPGGYRPPLTTSRTMRHRRSMIRLETPAQANSDLDSALIIRVIVTAPPKTVKYLVSNLVVL